MECEGENISRTSGYDDIDGDDNYSGVSGNEPADDDNNWLNDQVSRSQDRVCQLPPNDSPKQALADRGKTSFDEARYLAMIVCY